MYVCCAPSKRVDVGGPCMYRRLFDSFVKKKLSVSWIESFYEKSCHIDDGNLHRFQLMDQKPPNFKVVIDG